MRPETWADDEGAVHFVKQLKARRNAQIENLVGAAAHSPDPAMRSNWAAIAQLDQIIEMIEEERGNPNE